MAVAIRPAFTLYKRVGIPCGGLFQDLIPLRPLRNLHMNPSAIKPRALGLSCQSLGQSCAHLLVARDDAELTSEDAGEIREIVDADCVSDGLDQCAGLCTVKHCSPRAYAQQMQGIVRQTIAMAPTGQSTGTTAPAASARPGGHSTPA